MSDVLALEGPKLAGLQAVFFAPVAALLPLPDIDEAGISLLGDVQLAAGYDWDQLQGTIYTPALDVDAGTSVHGASYAHELTGFYNGDRPEVAAQFQRMQGRRFVLLYRDFEGQVRLVGDPRGGLLFSYKLTTGTKPGEKKGYTWSFKGSTAGPALFYSGAVASVPVTTTPVGTGSPVAVYTDRGRYLGTAQAGQKVIITSPFRVEVKFQ
ncbi:MAG: hypothetical protein ACRYFZ_16015 [Janthinobacterium lividum]